MGKKIFFWAISYSVIYELSSKIDLLHRNNGYITAIAMFCYMLIFLKRNYRCINLKKINLSEKNEISILWLFPLFIMPVYNMAQANLEYSNISLITILFVFTTVMIEESFFRGLLLNYFKSNSVLNRVIVPSLLFAFYHLFNVFEIEDKKYKEDIISATDKMRENLILK